MERPLLLGIESAEGLVHGTVEGSEVLDPVLGGAVVEDELLRLGANVPGVGAEQLDDAGLRAPFRGRGEPRRRRQKGADGAEELPDETIGGPVRDPDATARL